MTPDELRNRKDSESDLTFDWLWRLFDNAGEGDWIAARDTPHPHYLMGIYREDCSILVGNHYLSETPANERFAAWCGTNRKLIRDVIEAAEWYADEWNYAWIDDEAKHSRAMRDGGLKAKKVLTALKASKPEGK